MSSYDGEMFSFELDLEISDKPPITYWSDLISKTIIQIEGADYTQVYYLVGLLLRLNQRYMEERVKLKLLGIL